MFPYKLESDTIDYISPSIGISIYPVDAKDAENLLKHADDAMYHAKTQRNCFQFYTDLP